MRYRYIVTSSSQLKRYAFEELKRIDESVCFAGDFACGIFSIETESPHAGFIERLCLNEPIFVKHIMPSIATLSLTGNSETDLQQILSRAQQYADIGINEAFSVQCRCLGPQIQYSAKDVEVFVGSAFEERGSIPRFSDIDASLDERQKVISVFLCFPQGHIGCSTVKANLNEHCDEYRIFSRWGRCISRAEFKLMEALRKYDIAMSAGNALDLGAAPGGWTKVLADAGMHVTAVDPGRLHSKVVNMPCVTHIRERIESCRFDRIFDIVVNDMNIDPERSAQMMVNISSCLKPGCVGIMTAKLVVKHPFQLISKTTAMLEETYKVLKVKHLFHNRRDVTLLLEKKG